LLPAQRLLSVVFEQVPELSQRSHAPLHALPQQTPDAQNVEVHSAPPKHGAPLGLVARQVPLLQ
jgi:hypothetical protein